jgi:predicted unusual protein kinase regulating ubiquinone biosynthesis (AarF/ABC1/UbiB family)
LDLKITTPKPIGYVEFKSLFFFNSSYYISELFDYDFEIRAVFDDKNFQDRDTILKKFIAFTYQLHEKGVYHVDYSPGNILVKVITDEYVFNIIDVNRMKFIKFDIDLRMKSLSKLTANVDDGKIFIKYYSQISRIDEEILINKYNYFIDEQKKYLNNKKRLKKFLKKT